MPGLLLARALTGSGCCPYCLHLPCLAGQLGDSLQRLAAQRTASLKPAHQWVPWVVVNGIPLLDDDENVSDVPCRAIQLDGTIAGLLWEAAVWHNILL